MRTAALTAKIAAVAAIALCLAGCQMFAWMASQFGPEERIEAEYAPPEGKTILVLVEDRTNPVNYEPVKAHLTEMINDQLLAHKVAGKTIDYTKIGQFATASPDDYGKLSVSEFGARLGADMVLYVNIDDFGLRDPAASEELWKGRLQTTVRLVDVKDGRLWPTDQPAGRMVDKAETQTVSDASPARAEQISRELAAKTADRIAKFFYDHEIPYEGAYGDKNRRAVH